MNYKGLVISKLENALEEIRLLKNKKYPYKSSKNALVLLENYFKEQKRIVNIHSESEPLKELCIQIQEDLSDYMAIIGLIANSSNVRNLFEAYEPLWFIASKILEPNTSPRSANINLVVSSEWKLSPFIFSNLPFTPILKDYILIGLPASESANPLLIPLAGHELGHVAWKKFNLRTQYQPVIKTILTGLLHKEQKNTQLSLFDTSLYPETSELALKQAEETFCDLIGLRLFKQAYIYAFFYLLFPWRDIYTEDYYSYPPIDQRMIALKSATGAYKFTFPSEVNGPPITHNCMTEQCSQLCAIREKLLPGLIKSANDIVFHKKSQLDLAGTDDEVKRIADKLRKIVPATNIKTLSDIINAGWIVFFEKQKGIIADDRFKMETLMDLVAKNYEILAIEQRTKS